MDQKTALNEAITKAGGLTAFTEAIEAPSTHAVKQWRIAGVPEKYCPRIERVTGTRCEALRPDVEWAVLRGTAKT
jgi:DNA-binding transcriptional regulator YdaS (Cro superfamily)